LTINKGLNIVKNDIYCSTGTFVGRANGRNHRLIVEYGEQIKCDGLELMMLSDWHDKLAAIISDLKATGLNFPVVHADKTTGDLLSIGEKKSSEECFELFKINCNAAAELEAKKIVLHIWGIPDSDKHIESILNDCDSLMRIADTFNIDMLIENSPCVNADPLTHFKKLVELYPNCGFIIDTRPATFHGQIEDICGSSFLWQDNHVRHIHINDYKGGIKDWKSLYPIPKLGTGDVDFSMFFSNLKSHNYSGSITLESPFMLADGVNVEFFNDCIKFIRGQMNI
jgi:sugar phosphate isomerase/epimerase